MKHLVELSLVLVACGSSSIAIAQDNACAVALTSRAFNTVDSSISDNIAFAKRADLCNATYSSVEDARTKARSSGFNLAYDSLTIGDDRATTSAGSRKEIHQTKFCTASADDFKRAYSSQYSEQIADAALKAWTECIESNSTKLALSYEINRSGKLFNGTIIRTVNTGALSAQVTGLTVLPSSASVECFIGGQKVVPNKPTSLAISTTRTNVACSKDDKDSVSIAIQTSADSLPPVMLPSKAEIANDRFDEFNRRLSEMDAKIAANTPPGTLIAIDQATCPAGFSPFKAAEGRFLLAAGNNANGNVDEANQPLKAFGQGQIGGANDRVVALSNTSRNIVSSRLHTHGSGYDGKILVEAPGYESLKGVAISSMPPFLTVTYCSKNK